MKTKIYFETTIFNYYFDKDRDAHPYTVKLFAEIKAGKHLAFTSAYVVDELMRSPEDKREKMLALIERFAISVIEPSVAIEQLADIYVERGIIPKKFATDGKHIACATVSELDVIASLNFKHIVKKRTIELTAAVNVLAGYRKIKIYTPMAIVDNDDE